MDNTITKRIGECQLCEGSFKLNATGRVVLHGYKRPGYGYIVGNCRGVDALPYEVACDAIGPWTEQVRAMLAEVAGHLAGLKTSTVRYLEIQSRRGTECRALCVSTPEAWDRAVAQAIHQDEHIVAELARTIARLEDRLANWTARPLRTVDEKGLTADERVAADARSAARAAAKTAALAAKAQKKDDAAAKAAKRDARVAEINTALRALARDESRPLDERKAEAAAMLRAAKKDKATLGSNIYGWVPNLDADAMRLFGFGFDNGAWWVQQIP